MDATTTSTNVSDGAVIGLVFVIMCIIFVIGVITVLVVLLTKTNKNVNTNQNNYNYGKSIQNKTENKVCPVCHKEYTTDMIYCEECGSKLK